MAIRDTATFVELLPRALQDQIEGYVRRVEAALPAIFEEAQLRFRETLAERLLFVAALKKMYAICLGQFWAIDNSLSLLSRQDATTIRLGGTFLAKNSRDYLAYRRLAEELEKYLAESGLVELVTNPFYPQVLQELASGHD
jgi:hypothetical protein